MGFPGWYFVTGLLQLLRGAGITVAGRDQKRWILPVSFKRISRLAAARERANQANVDPLAGGRRCKCCRRCLRGPAAKGHPAVVPPGEFKQGGVRDDCTAPCGGRIYRAGDRPAIGRLLVRTQRNRRRLGRSVDLPGSEARPPCGSCMGSRATRARNPLGKQLFRRLGLRGRGRTCFRRQGSGGFLPRRIPRESASGCPGGRARAHPDLRKFIVRARRDSRSGRHPGGFPSRKQDAVCSATWRPRLVHLDRKPQPEGCVGQLGAHPAVFELAPAREALTAGVADKQTDLRSWNARVDGEPTFR